MDNKLQNQITLQKAKHNWFFKTYLFAESVDLKINDFVIYSSLPLQQQVSDQNPKDDQEKQHFDLHHS